MADGWDDSAWKGQTGGVKVSGTIILAAGVGMIVLAVGMLVASVIYRKTAGKRIRDELKREYE